MPIGDFEREVLRVIAANRNPDSFVGGATVRPSTAKPFRCNCSGMSCSKGLPSGSLPRLFLMAISQRLAMLGAIESGGHW